MARSNLGQGPGSRRGGRTGGRSNGGSDSSRRNSDTMGQRSLDVGSSTMHRGVSHERDERVTRSGDGTPPRTRPPSESVDSDDDDDTHPEIPVPVVNSRKWCYIWKSRLVCDEDTVDSRISRVMTQIFKKSIVDNGFKWKNIPQSHVDMYFDEFRKFYRWAEDDAPIKIIFIKHGRRRYSDMICKWKKNRGEVQPPFLSDEGWAAFNAYWDKEDTKAKALKMSENRKSETAGQNSGMSRHVGGSCSFRGHAKDLEKDLGREPNFFELMHKTHFKKDGSGYCDARSEKIAGEVEALKAASQGESGESVNMNDLYLRVAGVKKLRIFGTGEYGSQSSKTVIISSTSLASENEALRQKVEDLSTQLEDERTAREQMEERLNSTIDDRVSQAIAATMKQYEARFRQPPA